MSKPKIPIIETVGLKFYLDTTADKHNGKKYADFARAMEKEPRPTDAEVAYVFGVSYVTIYNWRKLYFKSKEKK